MAESMVREALKQGMKTWIVTSDRVRMKAAELWEGLEDVVVEARQEYETRADTNDRPRHDRGSAPAPRAKPKPGRARAGRAASPKATKPAGNVKTSD
jgi:hypothetical protein